MKSSSQIFYRRSTAHDAEAVFRLLATSVLHLAPDPYPQEVIDTWMVDVSVEDFRNECATQQVWFAEHEGIPIGFAQAFPGEIKRLFVDVNHAGRGVGANLMERVLKDALTDNTKMVKILALLNAVSFYERWGFRKVRQMTLPDRDKELPSIDIMYMTKVF